MMMAMIRMLTKILSTTCNDIVFCFLNNYCYIVNYLYDFEFILKCFKIFVYKMSLFNTFFFLYNHLTKEAKSKALLIESIV